MMINSLESTPHIPGYYVELVPAIPSFFESKDHV